MLLVFLLFTFINFLIICKMIGEIQTLTWMLCDVLKYLHCKMNLCFCGILQENTIDHVVVSMNAYVFLVHDAMNMDDKPAS